MSEWLFTNGATLNVGTMYCIGRNYAAHAKEMGAEVATDPIVFIKPPAAYRPSDSEIRLPVFTQDVHHEVELVVVIGADTDGCSPEDAWQFIAGVTVGLDLTARDVQAEAKKNSHPWAVAKSWAGSAPCAHVVPADQCGRGPWELHLLVNNELRQHGTTSHMERSVEQLVSYLSHVFTLRKGDCIFTGTPEGVAPVRAGDIAVATLDNLVTLTSSFA